MFVSVIYTKIMTLYEWSLWTQIYSISWKVYLF